jgi:protein-tyrosine phosphatase
MNKMSDTNYYIDVHAHILPGVDDGSGSIEETIEMLKTAYDQNIRTIIATPHYLAGGTNTPVDQLVKIREQVQSEAQKLDKEFKILLGNELYYSESVIDALKRKEALTLADSRYVLVEFSVRDTYERIEKGLREFIHSGYAPILAHVERYQHLYKREDLVSELVEMGCYIQMNSDSLCGGIFNTEANLNRKLFNQGLVHLIGSDCHNNEVRKPKMKDTVKTLLKKCDERLVTTIFMENPMNVLENTYI